MQSIFYISAEANVQPELVSLHNFLIERTRTPGLLDLDIYIDCNQLGGKHTFAI